MRLSIAQRLRLRERGYVQLPGLVSFSQVAHARREINISLGRGIDPEELPKLRVQSFCPELRQHPALMGLLLDSPVWRVGQQLIGEGRVREGSQGWAQINLRFPVEEEARARFEPHLDGMASPTNAVPSGQLRNFTALVGVMLSDMPSANAGNFTVWPGSHLQNAAYLKEAGPRALLDGMPEVDLDKPVQLTGRAGDVVFAHYLLSHGTAPNWSSDIRYMVFFRLTHVDHDSQRWDSLVDPWLQWPGLQIDGEVER